MSVDPAFRDFYQRESRAVFHAVYLLCRDRAVAEDSTQEAFARALSRWRRLRGEPWAAGWVMTTALNVARRSLRQRAPLPEPAVVADADLDKHIARLAAAREQNPQKLKAEWKKEGRLEGVRHGLREEKTLDLLIREAKIKVESSAQSK